MTSCNESERDIRRHAALCAWLVAMAVLWHYSSSSNEVWEYWLHFDPVFTPLIIVASISALIAVCYSGNSIAVGGFSLVAGLAFLARMPWVPTHLFMEIVLLTGLFCSSMLVGIRSRTWKPDMAGVFLLYAPLARWLLIGMYFYGTFHKLNPVFLSPVSSCAIPYIEGLPLISRVAHLDGVRYLAIYGTLILEFTAMLMLFSTRYKYYGMLLGMSFHFAIGISSYGTLAHFSTLAIGLHGFFLPGDAVSRFLEDSRVPAALKQRRLLVLLSAVCVVLEFTFARLGWWAAMNLLFVCYALPFIIFVAVYGRASPANGGVQLRSPSWAMNMLALAFIVHCAAPYLGLRTTAATEMFSGLRTEGGSSNHYVVRRPVSLFGYQDTLIEIEESVDPYFRYLKENRLGIVGFKFQRYLVEEAPAVLLPLVIRVNGEKMVVRTADDFRRMSARVFTEQSAFERFYLEFRDVDLEPPLTCRH